MAAIKIERRSIAVAVFKGDQLDYTQVRQLASDERIAQASTAGFMSWLTQTFEIGSAAVEVQSKTQDNRRSVLTRTAIDTLRGFGIPIWEFSKHDLFDGFAVPRLKNRTQLRNVIKTIWPILDARNQDDGIFDAAALGLYVATERLFFGTND